MAPKNLVSKKKRPPRDEPRTPLSKQSDGEKSDSDSDGGAAAAVPLVLPKKPKFVSLLKQPGPEPVESESACSSPSASGFIIAPRPEAEAEAEAEAKKKGKSKGKGTSLKVFSEDDVISLLKGLAVFWANGKNNKWTEFHLFVKDDLGNQFTRTQVSEKIRNLKKKFDANSKRARANGGRIDLSDPHESAVFELSKALWGDEKAEKGENGIEEANEVSVEKEKEQVVERGGGSKKRKKRKQVSENGEENEKSKKPELRVEELVEEGDVRDAANTILSIRKLVYENGEGSKKAKKKKKKSKEGDELDERKELVKEDIQVEVNDEGNKISSKEEQVEGGSERNKKKPKKRKKMKLVDECFEENKSIGEQNEVDELVEKSMKQVDDHEEEEKEVDELAENSMKQVDDHEEEEKEEELSKEGKQVDEHEQEKRPKKKKQVNGRDKKKGIAKPVDGHGEEENSKLAKEKQETAIGLDEFRSAYPLLYASFNRPGYPKVTMDECVGIGRDNARELEEKLREIHIETHRLELKKLDLMSCQR